MSKKEYDQLGWMMDHPLQVLFDWQRDLRGTAVKCEGPSREKRTDERESL